MDDDTKPTEAQADESIAVADSAAMLAAVSAERDALADQLLRLRAEFENFRKRAERERGEFTEFATMEAVRAVVPVLDDFERALKMESADKEYARGMELIYQRLLETLKKLGLGRSRPRDRSSIPLCTTPSRWKRPAASRITPSFTSTSGDTVSRESCCGRRS